MTNILLLEDETDLREELAAFLQSRGHAVREAGSLSEFWPLMHGLDIAVLDVTLPDGSGLDALKRLREEHAHVGIIMLTARGELSERLDGLQGGADHYLVKPFRLLELEAVIEALLRRVGTGWRIDIEQHRLMSPKGSAITLSATEVVLFRLLSEQSPEIVTRRALVEALGQDWLAYDQRRLDTLISRLRRRWREQSDEEFPLRTEYREGYSFVAPLQTV